MEVFKRTGPEHYSSWQLNVKMHFLAAVTCYYVLRPGNGDVGLFFGPLILRDWNGLLFSLMGGCESSDLDHVVFVVYGNEVVVMRFRAFGSSFWEFGNGMT